MLKPSTTSARAAAGPGPARWGARVIPASYTAVQRGALNIRFAAASLHYESGLERQAILRLASVPDVIALFTQPFTLQLSAGLRYTPDLLLVLARVPRRLVRRGFERWTVIEIKPERAVSGALDTIMARLQAVRTLLGLAAVCLSEQDLDQLGDAEVH